MGGSMSTIINATTTNGVVIQPDNSGSLVLQTNSGTTALTIDTSQRAAFVAGTAVNFSAGTKNVFVTYPAEEAVYQDASGDAYAPQFAASNGLNVNNGTIATSYTFPTGYNGLSAGDVTVASGVTITVPSGARWVVV